MLRALQLLQHNSRGNHTPSDFSLFPFYLPLSSSFPLLRSLASEVQIYIHGDLDA